MSKRKETAEPNEEDDLPYAKRSSLVPNKTQNVTYDFNKKTVEHYPSRLLELNRQFTSTIEAQFSNEPYSIFVTNCLDYVKKYFQYEEELLKYSPWLMTRLKQQRRFVESVQETINLYEALACNDFERLFNKSSSIDVTSSTSVPTVPSSVTTTSVLPLDFNPLPIFTTSQQITKQTTADASKPSLNTNTMPETSTLLNDSNKDRVKSSGRSFDLLEKSKQQQETLSTISSTPISSVADKNVRNDFQAFPTFQFTSSPFLFQQPSSTTNTTITQSPLFNSP
ncbi:unnamed protein product, partial [Didymodactylos carnosus]